MSRAYRQLVADYMQYISALGRYSAGQRVLHFLASMGQALDTSGAVPAGKRNRYRYNNWPAGLTPGEQDSIAIASDWGFVMHDIRNYVASNKPWMRDSQRRDKRRADLENAEKR